VACDEAAKAEAYIHEFQRASFAVFPRVAPGPREFTAQLHSHCFDVVVSVDTMREWTGLQALALLRNHNPDIPFILVSGDAGEDAVAECLSSGGTDCIDQSRPNLLPLAVALAVEERTLREERSRAEEELRRSQALYSALAENPTYGICRLDEHGRLLAANQALAAMLGYGSQGELLAAKVATELISTPAERAQLLDGCRLTGLISGLEVELTRKNGTPITVRLGGRRIHDETAVLEGCELILEDITAQRALEDHLRHLASTDALTGLANYRHLAEVLDREVKRSERTGRTFAVLLFDLDEMKQINDRHGHLAGDLALRRMADTLRLLCRSIDTPARYGGDEFLVILPETGAREARAIGRRICEHVAQDPAPPRVSTSVGVASYPGDGHTIDHLMLTADRALYRMKRRAVRPTRPSALQAIACETSRPSVKQSRATHLTAFEPLGQSTERGRPETR